MTDAFRGFAASPPRRAAPALVPLALLGLLVAACSSLAPGEGSGAAASVPPSDEPVPDAAALTAYDPALALDVVEEAPVETTAEGIAIHDLGWASPAGGRVSAWLVVPAGGGPFAGIVYQHGSETDRDDLLDEAVAMAHGGAVSIVIDAPFSRTGTSRKNFLSNFGLAERERDMTAQAVVDIRRAYDILVARQDVDPARLGFVGHSWGASLGVILAAVDERPAALVLITGRPSWTGFLRAETEDWVRRAHERVGEADWQAYLALMAPLDAMAEIGNVEASRLYLQYGTADDVVAEDVAAELIDAAAGAAVDTYDAAHALDDEATADRVAWLVERLGLEPIPATALAEVGLPDE
jgi:dienelactone hydrolase